MGKTIQAIALMLDNRPNFDDLKRESEWMASDKAHGVNALDMARGSTLLVLPTIAIRQWQMEIARFTRYGALRVKVYHGANRDTRTEDLIDADVVVTSYKVSLQLVNT
jgi:SNF2 family DNA or RNA helicase